MTTILAAILVTILDFTASTEEITSDPIVMVDILVAILLNILDSISCWKWLHWIP